MELLTRRDSHLGRLSSLALQAACPWWPVARTEQRRSLRRASPTLSGSGEEDGAGRELSNSRCPNGRTGGAGTLVRALWESSAGH